jgi:hypothetical protein
MFKAAKLGDIWWISILEQIRKLIYKLEKIMMSIDYT